MIDKYIIIMYHELETQLGAAQSIIRTLPTGTARDRSMT